MSEHIELLTKLFKRFPGIGERQARRFAYFIMSQPEQYTRNLSHVITAARSRAHTCINCLRMFEGDTDLCSICKDPARDSSTILVVEKSQDIDSFSKTMYKGHFFVLGGLIPIVQKNVLENTNLEVLKEKASANTLSEIILAFPLTPNGEHTDSVVREIIGHVTTAPITSLGRGLSTGAELEYADEVSLNASLKKRE